MLEINKISHTIHHTDEWLKQRMGKITASAFGNLIGDKSHLGVFSQGAMSYIIDLAGERVTGRRAKQEFFTDATNWGNANEPDCIKESCTRIPSMKSVLSNNDGSTHRLILLDEYSGCTPDALLLPFADIEKCFDATGTKIKVIPFEGKCPPTFNVFGRYLTAKEPKDILNIEKDSSKKSSKNYYWQVIFQMMCCNSLNGFFGVYHPDFPNNCNVIEFKKINLVEDFKIATQTLEHAKKQIDKWVEIFSKRQAA